MNDQGLRRVEIDPPHRAEVILNERSRRILQFVACGMTNKEVAHAVGFSESAAKWHVSRLLTFYRVPNRAALVRTAIEDRTIALDGNETAGREDHSAPTKRNVE